MRLFVIAIIILLLSDMSLHLLSPRLIYSLRGLETPESCSQKCTEYRNWLTGVPAITKQIKYWQSLSEEFKYDKLFDGSLISPRLVNEPDTFFYKPGEVNFTLKNQDGDAIHSAKFHINSDGWRATPEQPPHPKRSVIFFGSSPLFGYGVNDNETLPAYFSQFNKDTEAFNVSRLNAGPNDFLYYFRDLKLLSPPKAQSKEISVVYIYNKTHPGRAFLSSSFANIPSPTDSLNKPYYELKDGHMVLKDTFYDHFVRRLLLTPFTYFAYAQVLDNEWPLNMRIYDKEFSVFFKDLKEYFEAFYTDAKVKFYFVPYPYRTHTPSCDLLQLLNQHGVATLNFGDTLLDDVLPDGAGLIPVVVHPTPIANMVAAKMISDSMQKEVEQLNTGCRP